MNSLDWDNVRFFLAAARSGSLSAAGKELNANQPTVGRRISALEKTLGIKLFQRHTQGLTLTEDGGSILQAAQEMAESAFKLQRICRGDNAGLTGTVRVSAPQGLGVLLIAPQIIYFRKKYPLINFVLESTFVPADVMRGDADVAIRLFRPTAADLVVRRIGLMPVSFYASQDYIAVHGEQIPAPGTSAHNFIAYGSSLGHMDENSWMEKKFAASNIVLRSDSTLTRLAAVKSGLGIALMPDCLAREYPGVTRINYDDDIPHQEIWLVVHKDLRYIERIRLVMDYLSQLVTDNPLIKSE